MIRGKTVRQIWLASLLAGILLRSPLFAAFEYEGARVSAIYVEGIRRTVPSVVLRRLEFGVGDALTESSLNESLRRVRNMLIFDTAEVSVADHPGGVAVTFTVVEKWTIIPILKFEGTRGVQKLTTGIYDINTLGRYWETGYEYENLDGFDGGVVWFHNPHVFGWDLDLWNEYRKSRSNHFFWNFDRKIAGGFTQQRARFLQEITLELHSQVQLGAGWALVKDEVDEASLDAETRGDNARAGFTPLSVNEYTDAFVRLRTGQVNRSGVYHRGQDLDIKVGHRWVDKRKLYEWSVTGRAFIPVMGDHRIALRAAVERSDDFTFSRQPTIGGFFKLRGYLFEQFRSNNVEYANIEFRHKGWRPLFGMVQLVGFWDAALVELENNVVGNLALVPQSETRAFQAVGIGIRLGVPRIHRFIARLDYGRAFGASEGDNITFGFQQFF